MSYFVLHSLATQLLHSDMSISSLDWKHKERGGEKRKKLLFWQSRDLAAVKIYLAKFLNQLIWRIIVLSENKHRPPGSHRKGSHSVMPPHIRREYFFVFGEQIKGQSCKGTGIDFTDVPRQEGCVWMWLHSSLMSSLHRKIHEMAVTKEQNWRKAWERWHFETVEAPFVFQSQ